MAEHTSLLLGNAAKFESRGTAQAAAIDYGANPADVREWKQPVSGRRLGFVIEVAIDREGRTGFLTDAAIRSVS